MASKDIRVDINLHHNKLVNAAWPSLAAEAPNAVAGEMHFNTGDEHLHVKATNGDDKVIAYLDDIAERMRHLGPLDASAAIPTVAPTPDIDGSTSIQAGDFWRVTVAGTLTGVASGSGEVTPGDLVIALVDNPTTNGDYYTIEQNMDVVNPVTSEAITITPADWVAAGGEVTATATLQDVLLPQSTQVRNVADNTIEIFGETLTSGQVILTANGAAPTVDYVLQVIGTPQ